MRRLVMTIAIVLMVVILTNSLAEAQPTYRRDYGRNISRGHGYRTVSRSYRDRSGFGLSRRYDSHGHYGDYHGYRTVSRSYRGRSAFGGSSYRYGRYGEYGRYGRPSTNVRVRHDERWDSQGGQRSYEQSPDYLGKVIDSATILGILSILSH